MHDPCIRVGILDNDPLVLYALRSMLSAPLTVVWATSSPEQAIAYCSREITVPQVLLIDLKLSGVSGFEVAQRIRSLVPDLVCIGISAFDFTDDPRLAGADIDAYLPKESSLQQYVRTIGRVLDDPRLMRWDDSAPSTANVELTAVEIAVLREYLRGKTTEATAKALHISVGTVKTHMNNAYKKMGVHNRSEAILFCVHAHLL